MDPLRNIRITFYIFVGVDMLTVLQPLCDLFQKVVQLVIIRSHTSWKDRSRFAIPGHVGLS